MTLCVLFHVFSLHASICTMCVLVAQGGQTEGIGSPGAIITGDYVLPDIGAGTQTWVLWKNQQGVQTVPMIF